MKLLGLVLIVFWVQIAVGGDTCPYAIAPDGTQYDFSDVAYQLQQYTQYQGGVTYNYNISLCKSTPVSSCGGCYDGPGVCQFWGPGVYNSKCYGQEQTRQVIGLNNGEGIQIIYQQGDICGSCNPSGPRTSIITLTCNNWAASGVIYWRSVSIADPGMPPVSYFNGSMYCHIGSAPYSTPYPTSTPSASWTSCSSIEAPDGSSYDLSDLMGRDFSTLVYSNSQQQYSNITFSVCGGIDGFCGTGACQAWRSAAVCQLYEPLDVEKCFGMYNLDTTMEGLNYGEGVVITYNDGDKCASCTPQGQRKTVLRLTCNNYYFPSELYVNQVSTDISSSILYINATIGCKSSVSPQSAPDATPQPWWGPQPYWGPTPDGSQNQVEIKYYGYGSGCNGTDAFMVTVNRTSYCYPHCEVQGNKYVMTACDDDVYLPRGGSWVEKIYYGEGYYCDTPQAAIYKRPDTCTGTFNFSYQECDAYTVYTYSCNSPYCNQCTLDHKMPTESCNYGTLYRCVSDFVGKAYPNPLK